MIISMPEPKPVAESVADWANAGVMNMGNSSNFLSSGYPPLFRVAGL
jgi:hypothetical protein